MLYEYWSNDFFFFKRYVKGKAALQQNEEISTYDWLIWFQMSESFTRFFFLSTHIFALIILKAGF